MKKPAAPFTLSFSPQLPELFQQLNLTLFISTYQAGKVICISAKNENELVQLPRNFNKAMGIALDNDKMAIALKDEVLVLKGSDTLAVSYPPKPDVYDAIYMPRCTYYTGNIDIHDIHWCGDNLLAVNTSFSCVCEINDQYSFEPVWKPDFITELQSEDRCHLNGMAVKNEKPFVLSSLSTTNIARGWRELLPKGGVLLDYQSKEIIARDLAMPHSPRLINDRLLILLSASGELAEVDLKSGKVDILFSFDAFVRGMTVVDEYLFVGVSKLRENASTFKHLEIAKTSSWCGVEVLHLPTLARVGQIKYHASVDEIYDVQAITGKNRVNIVNTLKNIHKLGLDIPGSTYWAREQFNKD